MYLPLPIVQSTVLCGILPKALNSLIKLIANPSDETIDTVFSLQRQILQLVNEATATEAIVLELYGEIEETISDLEILQNVRERATAYYVRFYRLLLQVAEFQPTATSATLDLLTQSIEQTQATVDASTATIQEVKRDWHLT